MAGFGGTCAIAAIESDLQASHPEGARWAGFVAERARRRVKHYLVDVTLALRD